MANQITLLEWSDLSPDPNGSEHRVCRIEAVVQSVRNLLSLEPGDVFYNPELGVDLELPLFELMVDTTLFILKTQVIGAIQRWDPRVLVTPETTITEMTDDLTYELFLVLNLLGISDEDEVVSATFLLKKA